MNTIMINGKSHSLTYRTNSEMMTKGEFNHKQYRSLGCDVYRIEDSSDIALVLTSGGNDIKNSVTVITEDDYEEILELHNAYSSGKYHTALLEKCGAENNLELI